MNTIWTRNLKLVPPCFMNLPPLLHLVLDVSTWMWEKHKKGMLNCVGFFKTFSLCFKTGQSMMSSESDWYFVWSWYIKYKDRERERQREGGRERESRQKSIYIGSSYKPWVVQSSCTSKRFRYNLTKLQLFKDTSKCSSTQAREFQCSIITERDLHCSSTQEKDF